MEDEVHELESGTKSESKLPHINAVMDFLIKLVNAEVTGWRVFQDRHSVQSAESHLSATLYALTRDKNMSVLDLPAVATGNSLQGHEADYIFADWVVSCANTRGDLGIVAEEELCNVTFTRARRGRMSIVNNEIRQGKIAEKWKPSKNDTARGPPKERLPYLIEVDKFWALWKRKSCATSRSLGLVVVGYRSSGLIEVQTFEG